jgi:hypothetical protein
MLPPRPADRSLLTSIVHANDHQALHHPIAPRPRSDPMPLGLRCSCGGPEPEDIRA